MKKENIPNALTVVRLIFVPFVIMFMLFPSQWTGTDGTNFLNDTITLYWSDWVAFVLFVFAASTDFIDGYLARKWKVESDWGRLWDPIADKALVNSALITMCFTNNAPISIVVILIVRDICVDALRMTNAKDGIVVAAGKQGKLKTVFQMLAISIMFIVYPAYDAARLNEGFIGFLAYDYSAWFNLIGIVFLLIATVFSLSSMGVYFNNSKISKNRINLMNGKLAPASELTFDDSKIVKEKALK